MLFIKFIAVLSHTYQLHLEPTKQANLFLFRAHLSRFFNKFTVYCLT